MDQLRFIERLGGQIKLITANMIEATPFYSTKTHIHVDEMHISYTVKGKGYCTVNNRKYALTPGVIHLVFPNEVHKYEADLSDPYTVYFMHINWSGECPDINRTVRVGRRHILNQLFRQLKDLCWNISSSTEVLRKYSLMCLILSELLDISSSSPAGRDAPANAAPASSDGRMALVLRQLQGPPFEFPGIEALADSIGMSKRSFLSFFRGNTGMTAREYFIRNKMIYAKSLLHSNEFRKKEIAFQCGYRNTQNFSRAFERFWRNPELGHALPDKKKRPGGC
jgi:AraC-like DNA-binding protein